MQNTNDEIYNQLILVIVRPYGYNNKWNSFCMDFRYCAAYRLYVDAMATIPVDEKAISVVEVARLAVKSTRTH